MRRDPDLLSKPPAMPKRDLRERRPLSFVPASVVVGPSLDLGARWKKAGVRLALGLDPASAEVAREWELPLEGNRSASLSFCPVLINLLREATLVRRNELDFGRKGAT